jgi:uncharacterized protein GlcG (DUF336 family)
MFPALSPFPEGCRSSKTQIGGIGVGGGSADQDEECAKAGLEAVADDLK